MKSAPFLLDHDPALLEVLQKNHLTPLFYKRLIKCGLMNKVSPAFCRWLEHDYALALRDGLRQEQEALAMIQSMSAAGVEVMLLKGADLRLRLYDDPAARPMTDLDILVSPDQVDRAQGVLKSEGFRLQSQCVDPLPGWRIRFRNELHFDPPPGWPLLIDLHWQLDNVFRFYRLPFTRLEEKAITAEYQGYPVKLLAPEHLIIHLALHTYGEPQVALKIVDLALALSLSLDWAFFLEEVARFHCQRPLLVILEGISRLIPQKVPSFILDRLGQSQPSWIEKLALRESLGSLTGHAATLYHHRRLSDWFFYLKGLIWPQKEYLSAMYGRPDRSRFFRQILAPKDTSCG